MQDYEKLGAFYLGRRYDPQTGTPVDEPVLYDSRDLSTHAVIIGMTGSGKTGLGISLIEEAAIDRVPVIALDPKGDIGNLLLSFPDLRGSDFEPWIDSQAAATAGQSVTEFAAAQADTWRKGLAEWGQSPERIARLRAAADFAIYTPGSTAGLPISVLASFNAPPAAVRDDADTCRQQIQATVTGLLTLLGIDADPLASREHILLSAVLDQRWQQGQDLDLAGLIHAVQAPGMSRIGVMEIETFYPAKERFALAMRINNLLAAPGFAAWMQGEALDAGRLLYTAGGQPRVSVISIAHLNDAERMFFVTLLLNAVIAWMRSQPGTNSLRAILYIDEVFGYLPPVANPASKQLLLTLLKQARAFGLGLVLSTQNPVDLDYKALSNAGTWFIGRLQTEQDRNRVRDGLLSASVAGGLDPARLDQILGSLGKRSFLLHNVHESGPLLMQTRWAMSYLRGPLTRDDIRRLSGTKPAATPAAQQPAAPAIPAPAPATEASAAPPLAAAGKRPLLSPDIPVLYGAMPQALAGQALKPRLLAAARIGYLSSRHGVDLGKELVLALEPGDGAPDWATAEELDLDIAALGSEPPANAAWAELPAPLGNPKNYPAWKKQFQAWLRSERPLVLWRCPALGAISLPDESEGAFRARLQHLAREARDAQTDKLRRKHAARLTALTERLRRAEQAVEREKEQSAGAKLDAAVSAGSAILGALFGRRKLGATSMGRAATAMRKAGNVGKQSGDVQRAGETVASLGAQLEALEQQLQAEISALEDTLDAQASELEAVAIRPKAGDISIRFCGLAWLG
ncbi:MAG: DUF87 domain-containing protein [Gammaproteobacteria bacterium]|nr:DUF87 domain-containing protein [Gammaproteobacteria bacterium]